MSIRLKDLPPITSPDDTVATVVINDNDTNLLTLANLRTTLFTKASPSALGVIKVGANLSINEDGVLSAVQSSIPSQTGNTGKFLTTNGTAVSWANINVAPELPNQSGNNGKYLKTNGSVVSWELIPEREAIPAKNGNSGKFLTNNGTALSWATVNVFPAKTSSQRDALGAVAGTVIWNTDDTKLQVYTGSTWANLH